MLFVVAAIESPPAELAARADEITVNFPWGSLLRGIVRADRPVLRGIAAIAKYGARITVLTAIEDRDASSDVSASDLGQLPSRAAAFADAGLAIARCGTATQAEIAASGSSWAKRLRRDAVRIELRRVC